MTRRERLQQWKKAGSDMLAQCEAELRAKMADMEVLAAEIEELRAELAEIKACLPADAPRVSEPVTMRAVLQGMPSIVVRDVEVAADGSIADLVRAVLETAEEPLPAKMVVQRACATRAVDADAVHKALHRLKEAEEVEVTGVRPNSLYALKPRKPDPQTAMPIAG